MKNFPYLYLLGLLALDSISIPSHAAETRPNVVLIICDDLNDYMSGIQESNGHPQAIIPHMTRLAESGVAFRRAYSNTPVCAPSRSSFLTGIYPHTSGNLFWGKWYENEVLKNSNSLMEHFKANGYQVVGSGKLMHHHRRSDWSEFKFPADYGPTAFDGEKKVAHPSVPKPFSEIGPIDGSYGSFESSAFLTDGNPKSGWVTGGWGKNKLMKFDSAGGHDPTPDERNAAWAAKRIQQFAEDDSDQPFFLAVGFIRPHTPCVAPQKYFDMYPLDKLSLPEIKEGDAEDTHYRNLFDENQKGLRYFRTLVASYPTFEMGLKAFTQAYLACVTAVDDCVGHVIDAIDQSSLKENTIVIVTSDHGWQMGQKDYLFKNSPWEESTRIPMIIRAPGITKPGTVAEQPVSLIDLYPTLVDLCGLSTETRKNEKGAALDGHSMRSLLENPSAESWEGPEGALSMIFVGESKVKLSAKAKKDLENQHWALRTRDWRYIRYSDGIEELYDHRRDPKEWINLVDNPEFDSVIEKFRKQLEQQIGPQTKKVSKVIPPETPAKKQAYNWFDDIDNDGNGKIKEAEWLRWSKASQGRKNKPYTAETFKGYFERRDQDQSGQLTPNELTR